MVAIRRFNCSFTLITEKRIVLNETVEDLLTEHLIANKMKLRTQFTEAHMDGAFKGAHYDYSEAEVECSDIDESPPVLEHIGEPYVAINGEDKRSEEVYDKEVEYVEGLELSKTKSSGWSITGGLSVQYQGAGAASAIGYQRNQSKTVRKIKNKILREKMTKKVIVPPKHRRSVAIVQRFQRKGCKVRNVKVTFPKKAKFKCKVYDYQHHHKPKTNNKYSPKLGDLLNKHIIETGGSTATARLEGKYVWVESDVEVDVSDPQPI